MGGGNRGWFSKRAVWVLLLVSTWAVMRDAPASNNVLRAGNGQKVATLKLEHTLRLFDPAIRPDQPDTLMFSADGRLLFARDMDAKDILGWALKSERVILERRSNEKTTDFADDFVVTPDGRYLITAGYSFRLDRHGLGQVTVSELLTGRLAKRWNAHGRRVFSVSCDPRGHRFATIGDDGFVRLWDLPSCKELRCFELLPGVDRKRLTGGDVAFVPPGKRLLIVARDVAVWDANGQKLASLAQPGEDKCLQLTVSPDGKEVAAAMFGPAHSPAEPGKVASAPKDVSWVRLWDAATGKKLLDLDEQDASWVALHSDGRHLLTLVSTSDIVCWDLQTRRRVATWHLPARATRAALSPAGDRLATAHMDGTVRVWRIPWEKLP